MKSEWNREKLDSIAEIVMGQSPKGNFCNNCGNGKPLLNGPTEFGGHHPLATQFTTDPKKLSQKGDILFCVRGSTTGRMNWSDQEYAIGRGLAALRHKHGEECQSFLRGIIKLKLPSLLSSATGSTFPNVSRNQLLELDVFLPPLHEQKRISHILGSLDDKIELNRKMNETLEQMAQALFKSWFVDFDPVIDNALAAGKEIPEELSDRAKKRQELGAKRKELPEEIRSLFPDEFELTDELGWIPKGGEVKALYDTANFVNGSAFKTKDFSVDNEGLPIVKIAELKQGIGAQTKFTTGEFKEKYRICNGDMLYSWSGSPETSLEVFKWFGGDGWLNQHIFKINIADDHSQLFVYYLLRHMKPILIQTAKNKQTTGLGHITVADMKRLQVAYPLPEVMIAFEGLTASIYEKDSSLCLENEDLESLRDTLLPKLLSGSIDFT